MLEMGEKNPLSVFLTRPLPQHSPVPNRDKNLAFSSPVTSEPTISL